ncbi:MAG TPA: nuclear transport factor 2 family protein [Gammaproteobacteria bacterium]
MREESELLAANAAFYAAFRAADGGAMAGLWAARHPVSCAHPGWPLLFGREAVLSSWREIFVAGATPPVKCQQPRGHLAGELGYVTCYEALDGQLLAATNIFVREADGWRMVHHQSGPCAPPSGERGATRH